MTAPSEKREVELEVEWLADQALKFGYVSILCGIICAPFAIRYAVRARELIRRTGFGEEHRDRAATGAMLGWLGACIWLAMAAARCGGLR